MGRVKIIAEFSINHFGRIEVAHRMIHHAYHAGVDAVKFQLYDAKTDFPSHPKLAELRKCQLSLEQLRVLGKSAKHLGLEFVVTPFIQPKYVNDLVSIGVDAIKIREADNQRVELVQTAIDTGLPVYISHDPKKNETMKPPVAIPKKVGQVTWLYCIPLYPPRNYKELDYSRAYFYGGVSLHYPHIEPHLALTILGLTTHREFVVEVHVTEDRSNGALDNPVSLTFPEVEELVRHLKTVEKIF